MSTDHWRYKLNRHLTAGRITFRNYKYLPKSNIRAIFMNLAPQKEVRKQRLYRYVQTRGYMLGPTAWAMLLASENPERL